MIDLVGGRRKTGDSPCVRPRWFLPPEATRSSSVYTVSLKTINFPTIGSFLSKRLFMPSCSTENSDSYEQDSVRPAKTSSTVTTAPCSAHERGTVIGYSSETICMDDVGPHDVLLGRGAPISEHEGNARLRQIVVKRHADYTKASTRNGKHLVALEIVHKVRQNGGRFLRKASGDPDSNQSMWEVVQEPIEIMRKVKQLLRDMGPGARTRRAERKRLARKRNNPKDKDASSASSKDLKDCKQPPKTNKGATTAAKSAQPAKSPETNSQTPPADVALPANPKASSGPGNARAPHSSHTAAFDTSSIRAANPPLSSHPVSPAFQLPLLQGIPCASSVTSNDDILALMLDLERQIPNYTNWNPSVQFQASSNLPLLQQLQQSSQQQTSQLQKDDLVRLLLATQNCYRPTALNAFTEKSALAQVLSPQHPSTRTPSLLSHSLLRDLSLFRSATALGSTHLQNSLFPQQGPLPNLAARVANLGQPHQIVDLEFLSRIVRDRQALEQQPNTNSQDDPTQRPSNC